MLPFASLRTVLFQEIDAAGIVFFGHFFTYFHDAYVAWLASIGIELPKVIAEGVWAAPLVHAEADYARPLRFGDPVVVEVERVEQGTASMTVSYRVRSPDGACTFATGKTVHVFVDRRTMKKAAPPQEVLLALTKAGVVVA